MGLRNQDWKLQRQMTWALLWYRGFKEYEYQRKHSKPIKNGNNTFGEWKKDNADIVHKVLEVIKDLKNG